MTHDRQPSSADAAAPDRDVAEAKAQALPQADSSPQPHTQADSPSPPQLHIQADSPPQPHAQADFPPQPQPHVQAGPQPRTHARHLPLALGGRRPERPAPSLSDPVFQVAGLNVWYGNHLAVRDVTMTIGRRQITALIGPSGCGKSTVIRCLNRMNDLIPTARVTGKVAYDGENLYAPGIDPIEVRRRIGMVFQAPNPFPKSVYDNIAYGPRVNGMKGRSILDDLVEEALTAAALWDEVKDKLKSNALALSGGQQQRLCIARAIAVRPEVILMDEPCSALDPIATTKIEDLMAKLAAEFTIVIVTHNMQQAARVSDYTAFFTADVDEAGARHGRLVEYDRTEKIFENPADRRTEDYITGRFG